MSTYMVKSRVFRYKNEDRYSDLVGYRLVDKDTREVINVPKAEIYFYAKNNVIVNAKLTSDGRLMHKRGTHRIKNELKKKEQRVQVQINNINYLTGDELEKYVKGALKGVQKHRYCFEHIVDYLNDDSNMVLGLYGLRRTGKTVLMWQAISYLCKTKSTDKCAYITLRKGNSLNDLYNVMRDLRNKGVVYFFIDEITFLNGFITCGNILADYYTAMGSKVVLAGTYSLGIRLALKDTLYDRMRLIQVGYIPFCEQNYLTGCSLSDYVKYGGVLLNNGTTGYAASHDYVETAVIRNIANSLKFADSILIGKTYDEVSTVSAINRVLDSTTESLVSDILNKEFKSQRFGSAMQMLNAERERTKARVNEAYKNKIKPSDKDLISLKNTEITEHIDLNSIKDALKLALEIRDYNKTDVSEEYLNDMRKYLRLIGVLHSFKNYQEKQRDIIIVPWLIYNQVIELLDVLMEDEINNKNKGIISSYKYLRTKIIEDAEGRLLENIVLYNTMKKCSSEKCLVTNFENDYAEVDMMKVDFSSQKPVINLYEIKRSDKVVPEKQCRNICEESVNNELRIYGGVPSEINRYVIYNGNETEVTEKGYKVKYLNMEKYLFSLK